MSLALTKRIADNRCAKGKHDMALSLSARVYAPRGSAYLSGNTWQVAADVVVESTFLDRRCRNCGTPDA